MHTFVMRVYTSLPDRGENPMTHMPTAAAHVYTCIIRINVSYVYVYPPTFRADLKGIKVYTYTYKCTYTYTYTYKCIADLQGGP